MSRPASELTWNPPSSAGRLWMVLWVCWDALPFTAARRRQRRTRAGLRAKKMTTLPTAMPAFWPGERGGLWAGGGRENAKVRGVEHAWRVTSLRARIVPIEARVTETDLGRCRTVEDLKRTIGRCRLSSGKGGIIRGTRVPEDVGGLAWWRRHFCCDSHLPYITKVQGYAGGWGDEERKDVCSEILQRMMRDFQQPAQASDPTEFDAATGVAASLFG